MVHTQSTCCYCGVGCGVLIESDGGRIIGVKGDPEHPANFGRLCTKGSTLDLTMQPASRVHYPELRIDYGPGYRVYYTQRGATLVLLLCGGDKSTQSKDITQAKKIASELQD